MDRLGREQNLLEIDLVHYQISKWKLKFAEVEVEIRRSRQTNRRSRMLKHFFVQYDNFL
jgi:hypothetical protein